MERMRGYELLRKGARCIYGARTHTQWLNARRYLDLASPKLCEMFSVKERWQLPDEVYNQLQFLLEYNPHYSS